MVDASLLRLNEKFSQLGIVERLSSIYKEFNRNEILCTSSLGATSPVLLSLILQVRPDQIIHFIDTRNHFPETYKYKSHLTNEYNLNIQTITTEEETHQYCLSKSLWKIDADQCCNLKKVEPINKVLPNYKVWMSGLMKWQSKSRADLDIFVFNRGILRFYPLIDLPEIETGRMIKESGLQQHPLVKKGYSSIGCTHCTVPSASRGGRWSNSQKTECGLHFN